MEVKLNLREALFEKYQSFYQSQKLNDVCLIAGDDGQRFSAHRLILAMASPVFDAMFTNDFKEKNQYEIVLNDVDGINLKILINFCYSGTIALNIENVYGILKAASRFAFTEIESECGKFLTNNLSVANCLKILLIESFIQSKEVIESALCYAALNFIEIIETSEFVQLSSGPLLLLLQSDDLNVWSEEQVFNALVKWLNYDETSRSIEAPRLASAIRFTHIRAQFLHEKVVHFCQTLQCTDLIKDVFKWKVLPKTQPNTVNARKSTLVKRLIAIGLNEIDSNCTHKNTFEYYCPILNKWKMGKGLTYERESFCSIILNDELYILGGWDKNSGQSLKSVQKFNLITQELTEMDSMITPRYYFAAIAVNYYIYVAGGEVTNSLERFDVNSGKWTELAAMNTERSFFATAVLHEKIIASGGIDKYQLDSVEYYDPQKNQWQLIAPMNRKRSEHSLAVHNDHIYAVGGRDEDSIEYYDCFINKWTLIDTLKVPRYDFASAVMGEFLFIAGGKKESEEEKGEQVELSSVIKINMNNFRIENVAPMNFERAHFNLLEMPLYNPNI